jgi:hypothetical protein
MSLFLEPEDATDEDPSAGRYIGDWLLSSDGCGDCAPPLGAGGEISTVVESLT